MISIELSASSLVLLSVVCLTAAVFYLSRQHARSKSSFARASATPPLELNDKKLKSNDPLPDPSPYIDFDINKTLTRDYIYANKPLRFPYFQTMAHQKMHIDNWIELDKDYMFYLDMKKRVIEEQGHKVLDSLPENDEACCELLEVLVNYLPKVSEWPYFGGNLF